jgi:hypothetical protein
MALVLANRVQETGTANTTVSFTLTGAVASFQTFAAIGNTNTTYYAATDATGNWEVGLGTYSTTGPTLTRTTVYASSNSGSAVTFSGTCNIFVTLPSGSAIYEDASGNASALGTISSGTWNATTIGVAYGGTGVTASSGASSVMLRDANQNVAVNRLNQSNTSVSAAGGTTALTAASSYSQTLTGTGSQTFTMPDATTLTTGVAFVFNNNATGTVTLQDYATGAIGTITAGGAVELVLLSNGTTAGTWDVHGYLPEAVTWGTNALALGSTVITGGTWNGGTIPTGYGGTGLTTFTAANGALYSTSASALAAGTLPVAAGGTGVTTSTGSGANALATSPTLVTPILGTPSSGTLTSCTGLPISTGVSGLGTSVATALAVAVGSAGAVVVNGGALGTPSSGTLTNCTFPTLNQNTTGSAATFTSTSQNSQFNSLGVGTAGSATAGEIRATNNVTAYYTSDIKFKENIQPITGAGEIIRAIGGDYFDWTAEYIADHGGEDGYFVQKKDFGVIAQKVQKVFPKAVRTKPDGTLAVDYEKLGILAFPAIADMLDRLDAIEAKLKG